MGGTIVGGGDLPAWDPSGLFRPVQQLAVILALSRISALSALSVSAAKGQLEECLRFLDDPEEPHSRLRALLDDARLRGLQARKAARPGAGTAEGVVPSAVRALAKAEVLLSCARIAYLDAAIKTAQALGSALEGPPRRGLRARRRGRGGLASPSASDDDDCDDRDDCSDFSDDGEEGAERSKRKAQYAAVMCVGRWGRMLEEQEEYAREAEYAKRYLEQVRGGSVVRGDLSIGFLGCQAGGVLCSLS